MTDLPRPTEAEIEILSVLWAKGPLTVRDVYTELAAERDIGYTTILKQMQVMTEKGLLLRDESQRSHREEKGTGCAGIKPVWNRE